MIADNHKFDALELSMLPRDERTCVVDNELIISDNFDEDGNVCDLSSDPRMRGFILAPYPFKMQFAMVSLCVEGSMRLRLNLTEYELHRNSMMIVTPGSIGQCLELSPDCRLAIIALANGGSITEKNRDGALVVRKFLSKSPILQLSDGQMGELLSIYHAMRAKIQQPDFIYKREVLDGYMQVFYYCMCQAMTPYVEQQDAVRGTRKNEIFDRFIEILRENYATQRAIGFYADRLCMTPKYLSQVVHSVSGRHAGDWIRDYVILEAKALLKSGRYSVQQVSDMLNFANQSFFGAYFKRSVGCSPSAYRDM